MKLFKWRETKWGTYTFAICAGVLLYVVLVNLGGILGGIGTFLRYFLPVIYGVSIAYVMNPLAELLRRTLFKIVRREPLQWALSVFLTTLLVLIFFVLLVSQLIPQIADSISVFVTNIDTYSAELEQLLDRLNETIGGVGKLSNAESVSDVAHDAVRIIANYIRQNADTILGTLGSVGNEIITWLISFALAVYCLLAKKKLLDDAGRINRMILPEKQYARVLAFYDKCNAILSKYIVCELLDALIVGVSNMIFMAVTGMPYALLISVIIGVTNLVPTFGPIVGALIAGFFLLFAQPSALLAFLIFTIVLQTIDAYIIKPKMFSAALRIPPVWTLISIVVGGRMFGMVGILFAIPFAAIISYLLNELFEHRKARAEEAKRTAESERE